jgi:hypothetical protein
MFFPNAEVAVNPFLLILLGLIVGTLGGFFGVGGGFLITAGLLVFGVPAIVAVGTGMALILGSSIINLLKHRHLGNVDYRLAGLTGLGTVPGLFLAKAINARLEATGTIEPVIGYIYVLLLFLLGIFFIYDYWKGRHWSDGAGETVSTLALTQRLRSWRLPPHQINFLALGRLSMYAGLPASHIESIHVLIPITIGFAVGFLSGLLGAGGGFIMLPVMIFVIGIPTIVAVGTSLLQIIFTGLLGTVLYSLTNDVDLLMAIIMLASASVGSQLGANATIYVDGRRIRVLFGITVLNGGAAIALKQVALRGNGLEYLSTAATALLLGLSGAMAILIGLMLLRARLRGAKKNPEAS